MDSKTTREKFKSQIGFLLVSAGCAIGIGNVWKFPFITGQYGGGLFVLLYLVFLFIMGLPILTMELAIGRSSRKSVVQAYQQLQQKGAHFDVHGWVCLFGCLMLMMYYTTVSGWMLNYVFKFASGTFSKIDSTQVGDVFSAMLGSPKQMVGFMGATVLFGIIVCSRGLQSGIEKITKIMMVGLLALILILVIHSFALSGAKEGIRFYLLPSLERAKQSGTREVVTAAMNQSFFTLSLGVGAMEIFGSYMSKKNTLAGEAMRICILDTFVAIMAGLIIFPACFSYDVAPNAGPSLIFVTLPQVFMHMAGGRIWGTLFFLFMTFASFSTVIAVFENLIAAGIDIFGWNRRKSSIIHAVVIFITSLPCALGYNVLRHITPIGAKDILDSEDFIVSNLLLPAGALIFLLFCVTKWGWGFDNYITEANTGNGITLPKWLKYYFRFVLPILIFVILIQGLHS